MVKVEIPHVWLEDCNRFGKEAKRIHVNQVKKFVRYVGPAGSERVGGEEER